MLNKIQTITQRIILRPDVQSFSVIGDPGCEGLGTVMMQTYAGALTKAANTDMTLIAGDMVPIGDETHYRHICNLTEALAQKDVYMLRGNHDTGDYQKFFGFYEYAVKANGFTVVVIDNAFRKFTDEGLSLLQEVLESNDTNNVIIAFHIPLPNHFILNCVSQEEFERLRDIYLPYKNKIRYFLCGHVHSRFEDIVDGIPFICTGGGGAAIEDVSTEIKASDIEHHIVNFFCAQGKLSYSIEDLREGTYQQEAEHDIASSQLYNAVAGELMAHMRYLSFAERAQRRGFEKVSNLFQALAESEYRHAKSFFAVVEKTVDFDKAVSSFIPAEKFEYENSYKMMRRYAEEEQLPLTAQAFAHACSAEKIHAKLLKEAENIEEFSKDTFYVCPVCGYLMEEKPKDRCPVCGAPKAQFELFKAENR